MSRVVRAGIGAKKDTAKYVSKFDEDEGRLGSKTIKNQLSKSTKKKDREEYDDMVSEERMKTVVAFSKKRAHSTQTDSDSDDDMDSKSAMTAKSSTKASSALNSLFDNIGVNADEVRKREEELEAKRQKNREQRAAKKARKRASNQEEVVAVATDKPSTGVRLNLGAIGGDAAVSIYSHDDDKKKNQEDKPAAPVAAKTSDSDEEDDEDKAEAAADSSMGTPVARSVAVPRAEASSDEEDEEEDDEKADAGKKAVEGGDDDGALLQSLTKRPAALAMKVTKEIKQVDRPQFNKKDNNNANGTKKPFERKVGTGSFRFAHLPPDQRPTHDDNGKRLKYSKDGRIKTFTRSKQKNIKKDTRPDHLKPSAKINE
jgi:hypothetical protein